MPNNLSGYYNLHSLTYVSRASHVGLAQQTECVKRILTVAVPTNRRMGITGALLACDGCFVQILEGRRIDVGSLYERISRDQDHWGARIIASRPLTERQFASWDMCASTLSVTDTAIVEALRSSGKFDPDKLDAEAAMRLLLTVARLQTASAAP